MEKRKATYNLDSIKEEFSTVEGLRMTRSALRASSALGLTRFDIVQLIQSIRGFDLYKSMTSYDDHTVWQDVYHVGYAGLALYIKFTLHGSYLLISLKEK